MHELEVDEKDKIKQNYKQGQGYKNGVRTEVNTQTTFSKMLCICLCTLLQLSQGENYDRLCNLQHS